ncbi:hypothetical protein PR202_gb13227 [Eleusine coracana subsp. coracana]|uniref:Protein kinase domain-containing protein n=1 Tax=Eleusine coracana subsp. coracana TaxID=191504 RepID=A0AAV5ET66_ELECO|nr:hypothetical protein PR202_gb13227 [Eleusine coracana subsp. coracana]
MGERMMMKLMCSLGGRIQPRPGDGVPRYAGGETRIVCVPREAALPELMARLADAYGGAAGQRFAVKYQLPGEGLDALVSVASPEDLDNMVEEYDKLGGASPKLRVFLFPVTTDAAAAPPPRMDGASAARSSGGGQLPPPASSSSAAAGASGSSQPTSSHDAARSAFSGTAPQPLVADAVSNNAALAPAPAVKPTRYRQPLSQLPPLPPPEFINDRRGAGPVFLSPRPQDAARIVTPGWAAQAPMGAYGGYTHMHHQALQDRVYVPKVEGAANPVFTDHQTGMHQLVYMQQHQQPQLQLVPSSTYGFSRISEKDRVVSPSSAHSDISSSHQQFMQQQLPSGHGMAQQYHPVKPASPNSPLAGEGSVSGSSSGHREDKKVYRDNVRPVPPLAVPNYMANNVDWMVDSPVWVSPSKASSAGEQRKNSMSPRNAVPQSGIPDHYSQGLTEYKTSATPDTQAEEVHMSNANPFFDVNEPKVLLQIESMPPPSVANSYMHCDPNKVLLQAESMMPPPSVPESYLHNVQHVNMSHMPHMMSIGGPYSCYVVTTVSGPGGVPPSAYGMDMAYANATANPVATVALATHPPSVDQYQESGLAGQQFNNEDPWKIATNAHPLPPRTKRVASTEKKTLQRTPIPTNTLLNCKGPDLNIPAKEQQYSGDDITTPDLPGMDDGLLPPKTESSQSQSFTRNNQLGGIITKADAAKEVVKGRPADWISGFPVTDGRLQIIKNHDLEELQELGSGTFGTVYHGKWRGTDVAIKRINDRSFAGKPSEQDKMRSDFWNEASNLAELNHPNVVAFYGAVLDGPGGPVATVTEYMVNGSLRTALLKNAKSLDQRKRLVIAIDTAIGMEYLHKKNIVHFDLKSDNLLVNLRDPQRPICKVDVFSFGIVLWELLTGKEPYADLHYGTIIGGIVNNTLRPPVPDTCDSEWRALMEQCWATEPSERPSFTEVVNRLRSMAASRKWCSAIIPLPATAPQPGSFGWRPLVDETLAFLLPPMPPPPGAPSCTTTSPGNGAVFTLHLLCLGPRPLLQNEGRLFQCSYPGLVHAVPATYIGQEHTREHCLHCLASSSHDVHDPAIAALKLSSSHNLPSIMLGMPRTLTTSDFNEQLACHCSNDCVLYTLCVAARLHGHGHDQECNTTRSQL